MRTRIALGIDVSKAHLDVVFLAPDPFLAPDLTTGAPASDQAITTAPTTQVPNTDAGFDELRAWVADHAADQAADHVRGVSLKAMHACLEASGGYEQPVARWLHRQGATVAVVNPRRTRSYGDSQLRRSKTDRTDARLLARFCQREEPSAWKPPEPEQEALQDLSRGLEQLKQERDRLQNQRDRTGHAAVTDALDAVLDRIREQIDRLEDRIDEHTRSCQRLRRQRELLETIPGVGTGTATRVLAELGDPERFDSARQAAAYAGLTPSHHASGTSVQKRPRMSKIGNSRLRRALYFPAITALRCNRAVEALGKRLEERGKAKMVIIGAAMRKLLHICYGVLKHGEPFNAALHPGT